jgi:hypothetical protein
LRVKGFEARVYTGTSLIKKRPHSLRPPKERRHSHTVGSYGGAVSYERGTPAVNQEGEGFGAYRLEHHGVVLDAVVVRALLKVVLQKSEAISPRNRSTYP